MPKGIRKNPKLTKRQKKLIKAVADPDCLSVAEATRRAGYKDRNNGYEALQKPAVKSALESLLAAMEAKGITDELIAQKISEGLDARQTKFFAHEGVVMDERDTIDFAVRHKYVETVGKIKQVISGGGEQKITDNRKSLIIVIGDGGQDPLQDII